MKKTKMLEKIRPGLAGRRFGPKAAIGLLLLTLLALLLMMMPTRNADAAATAPLLGSSGSFAVLAGAGITNTGPTTVSGDIGTFPTTTMTGTGSLTLNGTNHGGDAVTQLAKADLVTAYDDAAGQGPPAAISGDLGAQHLMPGVYNSASSIGLTGTLTLDAAGDPKAVFVIQAGSTLTTASGSHVVLVNSAQPCNVFWQIGSSATLGTGSSFIGTILALTSITVTTGVTVDGRVLARNGAVTLDTDTITKPTCVDTTTTTTTTAGTTTTTIAGATTTTTTTTTPGATTTTTTPAVTTTAITSGATAPATTAPATTAAATTTPAATSPTSTTPGSVTTSAAVTTTPRTTLAPAATTTTTAPVPTTLVPPPLPPRRHVGLAG